MKATNIILSALALLAAASCQQNSYEGFQNKGAVYFQTNETNWTKVDSVINYSFVGKTDDHDTIWLTVDLMGDPSAADRHFRLATTAGNEATAGTDFEALKSEYTIKAGELQTRVPVVVCRTAALAEHSIRLALSLEPTDELDLGLAGRTRLSIVLSDFLQEPVWWNTPYDPYVGTEYEGQYLVKAADSYGPYSRRKHELCIQVLGKDFPDDVMTFLYDDYWAAAMKHMSEYFEENYPVTDENGEVIEPW